MKKALKFLGMFLMIADGLLILSLLITSVPILRQEFSIYSVGAILVWLAVFCGLFYLGYRLHGHRRAPEYRHPKPDTQAEQASFVPTGSEEACRPPVQEAAQEEPSSVMCASDPKPADGRPAAEAKPAKDSRTAEAPTREHYLYGMDRLSIYKDPNAAKSAWRSTIPHEITPEEVFLDFRYGCPVLTFCGLEHIEIGNGMEYLDDHLDTLEIPGAMRAGLSFGELKEWILTNGKRWPVRWETIDWDMLKKDLDLWCLLVRERAGFRLPVCVYPVSCPFLSLFGRRPEDHSGIVQWLRVIENYDLSKAIHTLSTYGFGGPVAILTGDANLLKDLSYQDLDLCVRSKILFALVTAEDRFRDLVTLREYRVETLSQPGSADGAEAGRYWYLTECSPSPEARVRILGLQIIADCIELGVDKDEITSLTRAQLQMGRPKNPHYTFTWEESTHQYSILKLEHGHAAGGIADADENEFRFKFLQSFVYHCDRISPLMRNPEQAAALLRGTKNVFGRTKAYQAASQAYKKTLPDVRMLHGAWNRLSEKLPPLAEAFHFRIEYEHEENRLSCVFRDQNLPKYRIHFKSSRCLLSMRPPFFHQDWSFLCSASSLTNTVLAMIWHAVQCGANSNIFGELRYNGDGAFLEQGKLDGPLFTAKGTGQYQVTIRRLDSAYQIGFYTDTHFIPFETKQTETEARINASIRVVMMEYFLNAFDALAASGFVRPVCKSELCTAFMAGRIPEERLLWPPLRLSPVRTLESTSSPSEFGQQDTLEAAIVRDDESRFFLRVQKHTVSSGGNGRPETMNSTACYPIPAPEAVSEGNWKEFVSPESRIDISWESYCGI